jgi:hypothetical protein
MQEIMQDLTRKQVAAQREVVAAIFEQIGWDTRNGARYAGDCEAWDDPSAQGCQLELSDGAYAFSGELDERDAAEAARWVLEHDGPWWGSGPGQRAEECAWEHRMYGADRVLADALKDAKRYADSLSDTAAAILARIDTVADIQPETGVDMFYAVEACDSGDALGWLADRSEVTLRVWIGSVDVVGDHDEAAREVVRTVNAAGVPIDMDAATELVAGSCIESGFGGDAAVVILARMNLTDVERLAGQFYNEADQQAQRTARETEGQTVATIRSRDMVVGLWDGWNGAGEVVTVSSEDDMVVAVDGRDALQVDEGTYSMRSLFGQDMSGGVRVTRNVAE